MPRDSFLVFGSPLIEQAEIDEVVDAWLGLDRLRPAGDTLRGAIPRVHGRRPRLALNSCTAALHLSLHGRSGSGRATR